MQNHSNVRNRPPLAVEALISLFDALGAQLDRHGCDTTLKGTMAWLADHGYDVTSVAEWLRRRGGYCDCEVLKNVEPKVCGAD
jgi:hypothetical protein